MFIHVGRSSLVWIDTASQKWIVQLGLGIGKSLLSLSPWPRRAAAALSLFPSFLWRSRDYLEISRISSLVPSSVAPPVCVCPLRPVGAAYGARSLRE